MSEPITLELAKVVCDTSYYGWLINFAQISKIIADKENVDYDEKWSFTDEIQKRPFNRQISLTTSTMMDESICMHPPLSNS